MIINVLASSSRANCVHIDDGETPLLLDCGLPYRETQRRLLFQTAQLGGVLLSHAHQDHCRAAGDFLRAGIDVYAGAETVEAAGLSGHRVHTVEPREQFGVGSWRVVPFRAVHDVPNLGFLLGNGQKKVLYAVDTCYIKPRFAGLTHVLVECNYSRETFGDGTHIEHRKRVVRNHMALETCKGFLRANDMSSVEAVYLLHLSEDNANPQAFKREIQAATGKPVYVPVTGDTGVKQYTEIVKRAALLHTNRARKSELLCRRKP